MKCSTCFGAGSVEDPVAKEQRLIERGLAAEAAGLQAKRLRAIRGSLTKSELDWEGGKERVARVFATFGAVKVRIEETNGAAELPPALQAARGALETQWKHCDTSRKTLQEMSDAMPGLLIAAGEGKKDVALLLERLDASTAPLPPEVMAGHAERAATLSRKLDAFNNELRKVDRGLEDAQKRSAAFEENSRAFSEEAKADRRLSEAKLQAYARVEAKLAPLAAEMGLAEARSKLLEPPSPQELHVEVVSFDPATLVPEDTKDPEPAEKALEPLPNFITRLFESCPEVSRLRLAIEAKRIGETGHSVRRTFQRFTVDRARWAELVTGEYREKWKTLLAKSQPFPGYPRPSYRLPEGFPIMLLGMAAVLGLAVLFVLGARMAR